MLPSIGITELVVLGVVAIVLFGKRLPEVARNVGKSYGELRKGLAELQSSINTEIETPATGPRRERTSPSFDDDYEEPTAPGLPPPPIEE